MSLARSRSLARSLGRFCLGQSVGPGLGAAAAHSQQGRYGSPIPPLLLLRRRRRRLLLLASSYAAPLLLYLL